MKQSLRNKRQKLINDLDFLDPNQTLVEEKDEHFYSDAPKTFGESLSRGFRSVLAVTLCVVIPALWYFDWDPSAMANRTSATVSGWLGGNSGVAEAPVVSVDPIGPIVETDTRVVVNEGGEGLTDYMAELNRRDMLDDFSTPAVRSFYENGVTIDYLSRMKEAGLLGDFSFPAIVSFYDNKIPLNYLSELKSADMLGDFSFPAVVSFYENDVTFDYLNSLKEAGFVDDFSFPAIVSFYENDVTVEFLQELQAKDLLGSLSFPDIVSLYNDQ